MPLTVNHEDGVSPVIGVILMVAIVVILAAVIAAFVFGMAGSTGTSKNVGLTATLDDTQTILTILWQGGSDINSLVTVNASAVNDAGDIDVADIGGVTSDFATGDLTSCTFAASVNGQRVIITGTFSDGSTQVLFDRRY